MTIGITQVSGPRICRARHTNKRMHTRLLGNLHGITGKLIGRFLNIRLDGISVDDPERHPHMVSDLSWRLGLLAPRPDSQLGGQWEDAIQLTRYSLQSRTASSEGRSCGMSRWRRKMWILLCWRTRLDEVCLLTRRHGRHGLYFRRDMRRGSDSPLLRRKLQLWLMSGCADVIHDLRVEPS